MKRKLSPSVEDAAADWLIRRDSGLTDPEKAEFDDWLSSDPRNGAVFARLEKTWRTLNFPRQSGQAIAALEELSRRRRARRQAWSACAGLAAVVALAIGLLPLKAPPAEPANVTVRPDVRHLPDGSVVQLNAGAQIDWQFTAAERRVSLKCGEALFSVAKDAKHPFVVTAGTVKVWAVGTAFNVRLRPDSVDVLVTEGKVKVDPPAAPIAPTALAIAAGEQATVALTPGPTPARVARVTPNEVQATLAWRSKRVEFTRAPLSEALKIFNRENRQQLAIGDASIRDLQITGVYWSDDPEGFIRLLNSGLDIRSEHRDGMVILRAP